MIAVVIFLGAIAVLFLYYGGMGNNSCCGPVCCGDPNVSCTNITNDPNTWPSGDRIWLVCHAIAMAEGANVAGSVPDVSNNPGDISDFYSTFGGEFVSGSNVTQFPDKATGWQKLYNKVSAIQNNTSKVYSSGMTWNQIAQLWAGDWKSWVTNVTNILGVSPTSTFSDYMNS